ncbi:helix-turn-helix transcriptional regulator [Candidatus Halocynthiibacter alkanivorans]|uniref:helix-turn-helix transcriptional regulator n=1 Tax=Candidatus Halocynthiibacter alkanivorans TaxID=2267619 RepID=UPI000DF29295|nr:AlpA family phage regulatory protein [Candidatus Halocynthiibacter alkanivorans]
MSETTPHSNADLGDLFGFCGQADAAPPVRKRQPKKGDPVARPAKPQTASRFLSIAEVAQRYGVSHATVWRWAEKGGDFPQPIKLSAGTSRWSDEQLFEFESRASLRLSRKKSSSAETAAEKLSRSATS